MIKNIVFDFNGTILDDVDVSVDALNACIKKFLPHIKEVSNEYYLENFAFPVGKFYEGIGFDFSKINYDELSTFFIDYYESRAFNECNLFPGMKDLLKTLKEKGFRLYILTATFYDLLIRQLKKYEIYDYFDGLIAQDNKYAGSKVEKAKLYFTTNNIIPAESIMIGDTTHDIEVANELNMARVISFSKGHNSYKRLKDYNEYVIDDYSQLFNYLSI